MAKPKECCMCRHFRDGILYDMCDLNDEQVIDRHELDCIDWEE